MTTINLIDKVSFQGKSFGEGTADFLLSPARIALNGRSIHISKDISSVAVAHESHAVATRILCGLVAILFFPITFVTLALKACLSNDRDLRYEQLVKEKLEESRMENSSTVHKTIMHPECVSRNCTEYPALRVHEKQYGKPVYGALPLEPVYGTLPLKLAYTFAENLSAHESNKPYNKGQVDFLLERVALDSSQMHYLSDSGIYSDPQNISRASGYTHLELCDTPEDAQRWTSSLLQKERSHNRTKRPSKIFLTVGAMAADWKPKTGCNHAIVIVIEPDTHHPDKANITVINPSANDDHAEYEDAIIQGFRQVYTDPSSRAVKNRKRQQLENYGCGLHAVENIVILKNLTNVQAFIERGELPDRTPSEVTQIFLRNNAMAKTELEKIKFLSETAV